MNPGSAGSSARQHPRASIAAAAPCEEAERGACGRSRPADASPQFASLAHERPGGAVPHHKASRASTAACHSATKRRLVRVGNEELITRKRLRGQAGKGESWPHIAAHPGCRVRSRWQLPNDAPKGRGVGTMTAIEYEAVSIGRICDRVGGLLHLTAHENARKGRELTIVATGPNTILGVSAAYGCTLESMNDQPHNQAVTTSSGEINGGPVAFKGASDDRKSGKAAIGARLIEAQLDSHAIHFHPTADNIDADAIGPDRSGAKSRQVAIKNRAISADNNSDRVAYSARTELARVNRERLHAVGIRVGQVEATKAGECAVAHGAAHR